MIEPDPGDRHQPPDLLLVKSVSRQRPSARSIARLEDAYENARLIHLLIHASWLNQIEIYFSICSARR